MRDRSLGVRPEKQRQLRNLTFGCHIESGTLSDHETCWVVFRVEGISRNIRRGLLRQGHSVLEMMVMIRDMRVTYWLAEQGQRGQG